MQSKNNKKGEMVRKVVQNHVTAISSLARASPDEIRKGGKTVKRHDTIFSSYTDDNFSYTKE